MANRLCRVVTDVPDYAVFNVVVPTGETYYAGDVLELNGLVTGQLNTFAVIEPATANLAVGKVILVNDGFEHLPDGRRPDGNPDYTTYAFNEGDVVCAVKLLEGMRFEISDDSITGTTVVGEAIYPVNAATKMSAGSTVPAGTYSAFEVLAKRSFRAGGQFGTGFIATTIGMVVQPTLVAVV